MDLEKSLGELAEAYAAGQMDEAELARRQQALLQAAVQDSPSPRVALRPTAEFGSANDNTGLGTLDPGMIIGPPERRFRLLQDLNGKRRIWLARMARATTSSLNGHRSSILPPPRHRMVASQSPAPASCRAAAILSAAPSPWTGVG